MHTYTLGELPCSSQPRAHTSFVWTWLALKGLASAGTVSFTANSKKVAGKSARDNPERYCGWFLVHRFSKKFQRMARKAIDVCLRVLKESNESRFDSYSFRNSVLNISHITFRDCRVHSFTDNISRNSRINGFPPVTDRRLYHVDEPQ